MHNEFRELSSARITFFSGLSWMKLHFSNCIFVPAPNRCHRKQPSWTLALSLGCVILDQLLASLKISFFSHKIWFKNSCLIGLIWYICEKCWHTELILKIPNPWNLKLYTSLISAEITPLPSAGFPILRICSLLCRSLCLSPHSRRIWSRNNRNEGVAFFFNCL